VKEGEVKVNLTSLGPLGRPKKEGEERLVARHGAHPILLSSIGPPISSSLLARSLRSKGPFFLLEETLFFTRDSEKTFKYCGKDEEEP